MLDKIPNNMLLEDYLDNNYIDSKFVTIPKESGIIVEMKYPLLEMENSINECLVRKEVLDLLLEAKKNLPEGITFKIWDAYRPYKLQEEIYLKYKDKIIKEFNLNDLPSDKQNKIISNYVSYPNKDEVLCPIHTTGGAVDLTLFNTETNENLDMGIEFDEFSDLTNTNAFENEGMDETIRNNRRMLYNAMTSVGFTNLPTEVWHYDFGDRAWAFYNHKYALYKGILNKEDVIKE